MWRSPIQICGTVRRPLFCCISARRAGCRSTRTFSICTPFSTSSRSADWQKGHAAVQYMRTRGTLLLQRQAGVLPRLDAARQVRGARKALLFQRGERFRRAIAAVAVDDYRAVLLLHEIATSSFHARGRNVPRAEHVAGGELVRFAHVDHHRVLAIDE